MKMKTNRIQATIPSKLYEKIEKYRSKNGIKLSAAIVNLLIIAFEKE